jgi:hypothetical protein
LIYDNWWKENSRVITEKYFRDLVDGETTLSQINKEDPRFYKFHQKALLESFYCNRNNKERVQAEVI